MGAGLTLIIVLCGAAVLQLPMPGMSASRIPEAETIPNLTRQKGPEAEYRIEPKVELDIRIEEACIYSTRFEVDEGGMVDVPFAGKVRAAGRTAAELASELAHGLRKYMRDPKVHVRVIGGRT